MGGDGDGTRRAQRKRLVVAGLAVLIVAIPIVIGIVIGLGSGAATATTQTLRLNQAPAPGTGSTDARTQPAHTEPAIPGGSGSLVALLLHPTTLRATPSGRAVAHVGTRTQFGSPAAFWVVSHVPGWLGVMSSQAGNNRVAWIAQSSASLGRVAWKIEVSLGARRLTVLDNDKVVMRFTVAVGQSYAPTPTGRFAVTDRLLTGDPEGPYGCCILALSAHSPHAIQGWTGGTRIAIHSTPETSSIGEAASHGCVRVTLADGRWLLAHIPLATPVLISS
ncbi:MAG TPA: L,D-transpeptidase [Solirubrobacteraceae bacterium]|nr:L,D-transpeptidase [Solirubrobacteraceae bacterium]